VTTESHPFVSAAIVLLLLILWKLWGVWINRPERERHYPAKWDGTHATCKCGHHSVWDYDLKRHFEETGRVGK
jgi:hypothetical protein